MDLVDVLLPKHKIESRVKSALDGTLKSVLEDSSFDLIKDVQSKQQKPYVVLFVGVNGSGKTTAIKKVLKKSKDNNFVYSKGIGSNSLIGKISRKFPFTIMFLIELGILINNLFSSDTK